MRGLIRCTDAVSRSSKCPSRISRQNERLLRGLVGAAGAIFCGIERLEVALHGSTAADVCGDAVERASELEYITESCVCMCVYVCVCVCVCACITATDVCGDTVGGSSETRVHHGKLCLYVCMHVCTYACIHVNVLRDMYMYMLTCGVTHLHTCICVIYI